MHNDAKPTTALTRKAVVLLSGGVDSTTALAIARSEGFRVWAISFDYGQRHRFELEAARQIATTFGVEDHRIVQCDLRTIGGSALTDSLEVPKDRAESTDIPITYVPARNTIFLSLALGYAEVCGVQTVVIGANAVDYSGYPDCRPEYLEAFERLANLATKAGAVGQPFHIWAPLLHMTKAEIIRTGVKLGVDYRMTFSCYDPDSIGRACGHCDSCRIRKRGFADAGVPDPTSYLAGGRGKP